MFCKVIVEIKYDNFGIEISKCLVYSKWLSMFVVVLYIVIVLLRRLFSKKRWKLYGQNVENISFVRCCCLFCFVVLGFIIKLDFKVFFVLVLDVKL